MTPRVDQQSIPASPEQNPKEESKSSEAFRIEDE